MSDQASMKKPGGSLSRQSLYSMIASKAPEMIDGLMKLTKSTNENVALGAYKVLINKVLPDIKAIEISGEDGKQLPFTVIVQPNSIE